MKYIYNKNIQENKTTKPFINIMAKIEKLNEAQNCLSFMRDEELWEMLEAKQISLLMKMFNWYTSKHDFELPHSHDDLQEHLDYDFSIDFQCQKNINSIEDEFKTLGFI